MIDWDSNQTQWCLNPRLSTGEKELFDLARNLAPKISGCIWIRSSGSTAVNASRWVCLTKSGFLLAAKAANLHLRSHAKDIWLRALPEYHVGGLAISARAYLSGARVVSMTSWGVAEFIEILLRESVTLTSLVPSQVFDLVRMQVRPPACLRAVVVGGDALDSKLYLDARQLGWPLLPSYGMTEMGSQIATASLDSLAKFKFPDLLLLSHVQAQTNSDQRLMLNSQSLFVGELVVHADGSHKWIPRAENQMYVTGDRVQLDNGRLKFLERNKDAIKVLGEWVSLAKLREIWRDVLMANGLNPGCAALLDVDHSRKGSEIIVVGDLKIIKILPDLVAQFNSRVERYEKVETLYFLKSIPKTDLGKFQYAKIKAQL